MLCGDSERDDSGSRGGNSGRTPEAEPSESRRDNKRRRRPRDHEQTPQEPLAETISEERPAKKRRGRHGSGSASDPGPSAAETRGAPSNAGPSGSDEPAPKRRRRRTRSGASATLARSTPDAATPEDQNSHPTRLLAAETARLQGAQWTVVPGEFVRQRGAEHAPAVVEELLAAFLARVVAARRAAGGPAAPRAGDEPGPAAPHLSGDVGAAAPQSEGDAGDGAVSALLHVRANVELAPGVARPTAPIVDGNTAFLNVYLVLPQAVMGALQTRAATVAEALAEPAAAHADSRVFGAIAQLLTRSIFDVIESGLGVQQRAANQRPPPARSPARSRALWRRTARAVFELTCLDAHTDQQQALIIATDETAGAPETRRFHVQRQTVGAALHRAQLQAVLAEAALASAAAGDAPAPDVPPANFAGLSPIWRAVHSRLRAEMDLLRARQVDIPPDARSFYEDVAYLAIDRVRAQLAATGRGHRARAAVGADPAIDAVYRGALNSLVQSLYGSSGLPVVFREVFFRIMGSELDAAGQLAELHPGSGREVHRLTQAQIDEALPLVVRDSPPAGIRGTAGRWAGRLLGALGLGAGGGAAPVRPLGSTAEECAICRNAYVAGAQVRVLPCQHAFHPGCIDRWLVEYAAECCVCRQPVRL